VSALPNNKLSTQLIEIKQLTSGFLEDVGSYPNFQGGNARFPPLRTSMVSNSIKSSATLTFKRQFKKHLLHEKAK